MNDPKVLLADEPTGNPDPTNRDAGLGLLSAFNQAGGTVVIITYGAVAARLALGPALPGEYTYAVVY